MEFKSLDELVKSNAQKNCESDVLVKSFTKTKISKYKRLTEDEFLSLKNRLVNFANYAKVLDKLDDTNMYFEVETPEGFSLLEYNGLKFKSIELDGDNKNNTLKNYPALDELNHELQKWINERYQKRCDVMTKVDLLEARVIQSITCHRICNKSQKPKIEEINEK